MFPVLLILNSDTVYKLCWVRYEYSEGKMGTEKEEFSEEEFPEKGEEFSELIKYTLPGYFLGLLAGVFLDSQGYQRSPWGSGL